MQTQYILLILCAVCLQLTLAQIATFTCPRGGILFSITPGQDRVGKISVFGHSNIQGCSLLTAGRHFTLFIPISDLLKPPCGIITLANGNYGATFITQAIPNIYTTIDRKYDVTCQLGQQLSSESLPIIVTGEVLHGSIMQQTSEVILEVRDTAGLHKKTNLPLGQLSVLYMQLPDTSVLKGMDIDTCTSYDTAVTKNGESIILFRNGCGTNTIFPSDQGFTQVQGKPPGTMVSPAFEMFQFITSETVLIECTFTRFCTVENDPDCAVSCPYKFNATRVKRSAPKRDMDKIIMLSNVSASIMTPNSTTLTMVHVFNDDEILNEASRADKALGPVSGAPIKLESVCMERVWFVMTLSTAGSVLVTLMVVCAVCCYKIRKYAILKPCKPTVPDHVKHLVH